MFHKKTLTWDLYKFKRFVLHGHKYSPLQDMQYMYSLDVLSFLTISFYLQRFSPIQLNFPVAAVFHIHVFSIFNVSALCLLGLH